MNSDDANNLKQKEADLAIEQAKLEQMKIELELAKMKQGAASEPVSIPNVQESSISTNTTQPMKWHENTKIITRLLGIFYPIGLVLVIRYPHWSTPNKIKVAIIGLLLFVFTWGIIYFSLIPALMEIFGIGR